MSMRTSELVFLLVLLAVSGSALADEDGGADLRAAVQNPIGSLISVPFKSTWDSGAANGEAYFMNLQPVLPQSLGEWNIVHRIIAPFISLDGYSPGRPELPSPTVGDGASGLGDINYTAFLSPAVPKGAIWGVGPSITGPSATDTQLGAGKWAAGPSFVVLFQPKFGTYGFLARQLWSFAGQSNRQDTSSFLVEPFINYNLPNGWYLISDMVLTANWEAESGQQWTVPVGAGVGKLFTIGSQAMNTRVEYYANVEKPDGAPDWSVSWTIQFLFPK
ncbi:MAG: hypothetical protein ACI9UK_001595 [Candidatus Krumholzibacteriia bacterium]|jgi:hypothetical protein